MKNLSNIIDELDIVTKEYVDDIALTKVDKIEGKGLSTNDFSNKYKNKLEQLNIVQVTELPIATYDNVGQIIQYIGVTNESYTNGFFYKNIEIDSDVFSWENISVQHGGAGGANNNYNDLENRPTLNGITIQGNKTAEDYGIKEAISTFTGTQENPIDFSNLFENIGNETDGWYNQICSNYCFLRGYIKMTNGIIKTVEEAFSVDPILVTWVYIPGGLGGLPIISLIDIAGNLTYTGNVTQGLNPGNNMIYIATNNTNEYTPTENYHPATKKYVDENVPKTVSELTNDANFITNTVNNLTNYYTKNEIYTQAEVNGLINALTTLNIEVVTSLPTSNISSTTIYLKGSKQEGNNSYEEYIYVNGAWELIGTTEIDLTSYATKTYVDTKFDGITKSSLGLGNVENKSSATIRGEITSSNVTTALGFTPAKSDHTHSNYSYLEQSTKIPTNANAEQYYKLFTITPLASGYKDFHYAFEVVGRSKTLTKIYLTVATENNNYLKTAVANYEGSTTIANNLKVYYFEDTTNATSRIEVWAKITSWNVLSFYPKTAYNIGGAVTLTWNMEKGNAFPTDFTTDVTIDKRTWTGNAATATTATNATNADKVKINRSSSNGYYPALLTNQGDGITVQQDSVFATSNNTVTINPSTGAVKATKFEGSLTGNVNGKSTSTDRVNVLTIAADTDLNNVTTPGFHRCNQNSTATTLTNCPVDTAFFMLVGQSAYTFQLICSFGSNPKTYIRHYSGSSWYDWKKIYSEADSIDRISVTDTRSTNENPKWYLTNYKKSVAVEFKTSGAIGISSGVNFATLVTYTSWVDNSGGYPIQQAFSNDKIYVRIGTSDTAWSSWSTVYTTTNKPTLSDLGVTATAAELNKMDGVTATTAELNYVDGVTSNIQTQLNAKAIKPITYTTTIPTSGWTSTAPYYVDVTVSGVLATDVPMVAPTYSGTLTTDQARKNAWNKIDRIVTSANKIRAYAFEEKPTTAIPIQLTITR